MINGERFASAALTRASSCSTLYLDLVNIDFVKLSIAYVRNGCEHSIFP